MDNLLLNLKYKLFAVVVFPVLLFLDQFSKEWVREHLQSGPIVILEGVLELRYSENRGAVWGFAQGSVMIMAIISIVIFLLVLFFFVRLPAKKIYIPMHVLSVLILAGAAGNLIDRILMKFVTDFIYFRLINFPIFNVADIYITVSTFVMILLAVTIYREEDWSFLKIRKKERSE